MNFLCRHGIHRFATHYENQEQVCVWCGVVRRKSYTIVGNDDLGWYVAGVSEDKDALLRKYAREKQEWTQKLKQYREKTRNTILKVGNKTEAEE